MSSRVNIVDRLIELVPSWLAWPMSALSTLAAFAGAGLVFAAASLGSVRAAIWAGIAFGAAAILWHLADYAAGNRS